MPEPYLTLRVPLAKSVNALDADVAWQKYRDQLAQLEARTTLENERQRMAWGAYQQLLAQNHSLLRSMAKSSEGSVPPQGVRDACRRGLKLVPEYGGDGLTEGAKSRARAMAAGSSVSDENLKRMKAFFARHTYEKTASPPSPGYVAWLLWGGDAGKAWANAQVEQMHKAGNKPLGAAFSHARRVAKKKGKAGDQKAERAIAQRYLTAHGHGKMEPK